MKSTIIGNKSNDLNLTYRIVIKFADHLHLTNEGDHVFANEKSHEYTNLNKLLRGFCIRKLFISINAEQITGLVYKAKTRDENYQPPNFLNYYVIDFSTKTEAQQALDALIVQETVDAAYMEINPVLPPAIDETGNTQNIRQNYFDPAPAGIDAKYAWQFKGGDGTASIKYIDIEQGWIENHESVFANTLVSSGISHSSFRDHGTAVLGIINMKGNEVAGPGITPEANGYIISQWRPDGSFNTAEAVLAAICNLCFGDILLLQTQAYDPISKKTCPVEICNANFELIRLATALGIIVIEPGGNGNGTSGNDLDAFTTTNGKASLNRFSPDFKDSGAVIVAAASSASPHKKISYSNYGSRIDCYAWGENVSTAGAFPNSSGTAINTYTKKFGGTSSASAIITGTAIAIQSISEANYNRRLSPAEMRKILSSEFFGTRSVNGHAVDRIGVMPDLKKIINHLLKQPPGYERKSISDVNMIS